jgi:CheY-like chemotaxis protein
VSKPFNTGALVSTSDRFDVEGMMTAFSEFPELFLQIPGAGVTMTQPFHINPTILIADDNHQNLQVLGTMLQDLDYDVAFSDSGPNALAIAAKLLPDLILLDVMMPEMDGFQVCRLLKHDAATWDIPVVFLTAKTDPQSILSGFDCGALDYITKPFNKNELQARVRTHVALRRSQRDLREKNEALQKALDEIKTLRGIIPICASCKKIRDDEGLWKQIESYIQSHSEASFSHSICPDCMHKLYGDQQWLDRIKTG